MIVLLKHYKDRRYGRQIQLLQRIARYVLSRIVPLEAANCREDDATLVALCQVKQLLDHCRPQLNALITELGRLSDVLA